MTRATDVRLSISVDALLAIPAHRPEKLFSGDDEADRALYRTLALGFHPDRFPAHAEAFKHLGELRAERDRQVRADAWCGAGVRQLTLRGGKRLKIRYLRRYPFELGTVLIGRRSVAYLFRAEHAALYAHAIHTLQGLPCANDAMRGEIGRFIPRVELRAETADGPALVLSKSADAVRLRDALEHLGGRMDPRHVAWILGTLHNAGAYLQWAGMTHNAIDVDSWFISPSTHSGMLLGGWGYARPAGGTMTHLPASSASVWRTLPARVTAEKRATPALDRELIRLIGRTLLGDPGGTRLLRDWTIPPPLRRWVTTPGAEDGIEDYANWARARDASFGPRKFVPMDLTPREMYGE